MNPTELFLSILIKEARKHGQEHRAAMPLPQWLAEFRTVTLGLPRGVGKTEAVLTLAAKHSSLVLTPTDLMARQLERRYDGPIETIERLKRWITFGGPGAASSRSFGARPLELLLVDEGVALSREDRQLVSHLAVEMCLHGTADQATLVIVLIGT